MNSALRKAQDWLSEQFDEQTRQEVRHLIDNDPEELNERFYKDLEFGTGGMRGIMGVGTNRINPYTLGKNTQGLSNYLNKLFPNQEIKVAIAYDCRHQSDTLARTVAEVLSANGIRVYLFSELRTTPELSFAVRHLSCHAGIVLTASHNPPEYNGYKVYWSDGGQIVPPQDREIVDEIQALGFEDINFDTQDHLIEYIDEEVDREFFEASVANGSIGAQGKDDFHIVFTSLHGTSITAIPEVLRMAGYRHVTIIEEQATPNGDFPTVKSPNPEEPEALELAIRKAEEIGADIVVGTDPDSDRLGIAVRNAEGRMELLNGNQTMVLMTRYLLDFYQKKGFRGNEFVATTIVSTPMVEAMAKAYGVDFKTALTGFKWIGKMIRDYPDQRFIGGGEESFGYMVGDFVRDKDAVTSTLLACEIACQAKFEGSSFYQRLIDCYVDFGCYREKLISLTKKGISGAEEIKQMLTAFRDNPPASVQGSPLRWIEDYNTSTTRNVQDGSTRVIDLPKSNVLIYETEDGTRIAARPSGTEPKVKFYISTRTVLPDASKFAETFAALEEKMSGIVQELSLG